MDDKNLRRFIIMTDLDSTFEEYLKPDAFNYVKEGEKQFDAFARFLVKFEKEHNCEIRIHFVSGTSIDYLNEKLNYFKNNYPNSIYKRIRDSVLGAGNVFDREGNKIDKVNTDGGIYNKADGVNQIINYYRGRNVVGACYLGDDKNDIPGFNMIKGYRLPLGSYALAPRSSRDYELIKTCLDFYSSKPRIFGCVECLEKMSEKINNILSK